MVIDRRIIAIAVIIIVGAGVLIISGALKTKLVPLQSFQTPNGNVNIWVPLPETPQNVTKLRVVPGLNETEYFSVTNLEQIRQNATPVEDVPKVMSKTLENYGGLPEDAVMVYAETGYLEGYESSNIPFFPDRLISKDPISTDVQYGRKINGIMVTGEGSFIKVILGNDGELLYLNKVWRTVEPAGTERIIPVSKAIEKLGHGEILNPKKCFCDVNVDRIYIAYWENGAGVEQEYLDPVWVFSGTTSSGDAITYKVYARDDAGSSGTALSGLSDIHTVSDPGSRLPIK